VALAGGIAESVLESDETAWVDGVAIIVTVFIVTVAGVLFSLDLSSTYISDFSIICLVYRPQITT